MVLKRKRLSRRQKAALVTGREIKPIQSVKYILTCFILVVGVSYGLHYAYIHQWYGKLTAPMAERTETCTVTKTDYSDIFDSTCGKLTWGAQMQGTPSSQLQIGSRYQFTYNGARFDWLTIEPKVSKSVPIA